MPKFVPAVGTFLTVSLPGELLRAKVHKIVTRDAVIAEIMNEPMAKSHKYKLGDVISCRRKPGIFGEEWEAVSEPRTSVEQLVKQEEEHAIASRIEQRPRKHSGIDAHGKVSAKAGGGDSIAARKTKPKGKSGGLGKRSS